MASNAPWASIHAGILLALAGLVAWATGLPFIFPSLGPSAFVLATMTGTEATNARRIVGGHLVGVVVGLGAYHLLAADVVLTTFHTPFSLAGLRLAASGVVSVTATTGVMIATDTTHPPACATTLIVSLGLLSTPLHALVIMAAVGVLVAADRLLVRASRRTIFRADLPGQ